MTQDISTGPPPWDIRQMMAPKNGSYKARVQTLAIAWQKKASMKAEGA